MENSLKTLTMAAGIFITCVLISFSLFLLREGMGLGRTFAENIVEDKKAYGEYKWIKYETDRVSGAELINAIGRYQDELYISVSNTYGTITYSKSNKFKISDNISTASFYIEPYDDYIGEIIRGGNDGIIGMKFKKVK